MDCFVFFLFSHSSLERLHLLAQGCLVCWGWSTGCSHTFIHQRRSFGRYFRLQRVAQEHFHDPNWQFHSLPLVVTARQRERRPEGADAEVSADNVLLWERVAGFLPMTLIPGWRQYCNEGASQQHLALVLNTDAGTKVGSGAALHLMWGKNFNEHWGLLCYSLGAKAVMMI